MRAVSFLAIALFALAPALQGQSSPRDLLAHPVQPEFSCPLSVSVELRGLGSTVEVQAARPKGSAQLLEIGLRNLRATAVLSVDLTLYGFSPSLRAMPVLADAQPDVVRPLHLAVNLSPLSPDAPDTEAQWQTEQWIAGLSAFDHAALTAVTFADGSQWRAATPSACIFRPAAIMPVDTRP
jgi:hypothetical protein